jgi:hypothetical protein
MNIRFELAMDVERGRRTETRSDRFIAAQDARKRRREKRRAELRARIPAG